jgi:hypothetical protein
MAKVVKYVLQIVDKASPALNKGAKEADKYDDKLKDVDKSQEKVGVSAKAVAAGVAAVGLAAVGAAKAAYDLNQRVADLRNDLNDAATRSGIAAEMLAGLRLAAEGSGQSFGALTSGLDKFGVQMANAARGGNVTAESFKKLGIDVVDANGAMRDGTEVFTETLAALNAMPPSAERSALAVDALGRSGGKLLQALSGSELEGFVDLAREFGVGVGPDASEAAGDWQRNVANLNLVLDGLSARVADLIGGPDSLQTFTKFIIFGSSVLESFASIAVGSFVKVKDAWVGVFTSIADGIVALGQAFKDLSEGDILGAAVTIAKAQADLSDKVSSAMSQGIETTLTLGFTPTNILKAFDDAADKTIRFGALTDATAVNKKEDDGNNQNKDKDKDKEKEKEKRIEIEIGKAAAKALEGIFRDADAARRDTGSSGLSADILESRAKEAAAADLAAQKLEAFALTVERIGKVSEGITLASKIASGNIPQAVGMVGSKVGGVAGAAMVVGGQAASLLTDIGGAGVAQADADALARAQRKAERTGKDVSEFRTTGTDKEAAKAAAEGVSSQMEGFLDALLAGIQALPDIISKVLPKFATKFVGDFLPGIAKMLPKLISAITTELPVQIIKGLPKAIASLLKGLFVDLPRDFARAIGRLFTTLPQRIGRAIAEALGLARKTGTQTKAETEASLVRYVESTSQVNPAVSNAQELRDMNSRASRQSRQAASIATAPAVRSRMDVARRPPSQSSRNAGPLRQGNPFSEFAKMQDSQGGPYGRDLSISTLTR